MINAEALLRLADKLEGVGPYAKVGPVPEDAFNIGYWYAKEDKERIKCGYSACACGWAATDPWFKKRGFKLDGDKTPSFKEVEGGFYSVQEFFGLSSDDSLFLFSNSRYGHGNPSQFEVARRIREFVSEKQLKAHLDEHYDEVAKPYETQGRDACNKLADKMEEAIFADLWSAIAPERF